MNTEALRRLATKSKAVAKAYVNITEALMQEGVPEQEARHSAQIMAYMAAFDDRGSEPWEEGP